MKVSPVCKHARVRYEAFEDAYRCTICREWVETPDCPHGEAPDECEACAATRDLQVEAAPAAVGSPPPADCTERESDPPNVAESLPQFRSQNRNRSEPHTGSEASPPPPPRCWTVDELATHLQAAPAAIGRALENLIRSGRLRQVGEDLFELVEVRS